MIFVAWTIKDVKLFRALTLRSNRNSTVIVLRLSAYFYAKYFGLQTVSLWQVPVISTLMLWFKPPHKFIIDSRFYDGLGISNRYLAVAFSQYLRELRRSLRECDDVVFLTGTSRLNEQAIQYHFRSNAVIYWEAGINGTIYMSEKGVNANADFRELSHGQKSKYSALFAKTCRLDTESKLADVPNTELFFKVIDGLYLLFARYILFNKEIDEILNFGINFKRERTESVDINKSSDYFLYIDQVEQDTNYTHFGCNTNKVTAYIRSLMENYLSREEFCLVRRAHPRQFVTKVAKQLKSNFPSNYYDDSASDLTDSIIKAKLVITVNSTAGVESLLLGKPILVLGESYFDQLYGVLSLEESIQLASDQLILDVDKIKNEVSEFLEYNFIPIDFRSGEFFLVEGFDEFLDRTDGSVLPSLDSSSSY